MNVNELAKKYGDEARARRMSKVECDTEMFVQIVDDWSHYFEHGYHKYEFMKENDKFIEKYEPYCLYFYIGETSADAIAKVTEEYSSRGFGCRLSRDKKRFMIVSRYILHAILNESQCGDQDRETFIPDIDDDSRDFYVKIHEILEAGKDCFGGGKRAALHKQLWEMSMKINKIGVALTAGDKSEDETQLCVERIVSILMAICGKFSRSADRLADELEAKHYKK